MPSDEQSAPPAADRVRTVLARGIESGITGVDRGRGIIHGYSVITAGEVRGWDLWADEDFIDQVVAAGNAVAGGIKSRFTHPGLSSDGLGTFLGRSVNFRREDGRVRADLHLADSAQTSPKGDLRTYVLDLAAEDPDAFGASIVYRRDLDAEQAFRDAHADEKGTFQSPDPGNVDGLPHTRLARLAAVDAVDTPAANAGLFGEPETGALAEAGDRFLDWALGVSQTPPTEALIGTGVSSDRARQYLQRYLERRSLMVVPRNSLTEDDDMAEAMTATLEVLQTDLDARFDEGAKTERERLDRLRAAFADRPGFVLDEFQAGHDVAEAQLAVKDLVIAEQKAQIEALKDGVSDGAEAAGHSESAPVDFEALARDRAKADGISLGDAMSRLAREDPPLADAWRARQTG